MNLSAKTENGNEGSERTHLAERLREAREYLGLSQDEVAKFVGIPRTALSNMETGQRRVEAVELKRLATLYKQPLTYFTGEPGPPQASLPKDVELLARKASKLTTKDRQELTRFADFLRSRQEDDGGNTAGER